MFSLVYRYFLIILPLVKAVQIPVDPNSFPQSFPNFHQDFFDNINHLTKINRHNVEYIKPSIELGSFTIQTVLPVNNNNFNHKENINEIGFQNTQGQQNQYQTQNVAPLDVPENNGYLPPYLHSNSPHEEGIRTDVQSSVQNSISHGSSFAVPVPTFLRNLPRPLYENHSHQTYGQAPLPNHIQTQTQVNTVPHRRPYQENGPTPLTNPNQSHTHLQDNTAPERRFHQTYEPPLYQNYNQIQTHIQGNTVPERRPHQVYGPAPLINFNHIQRHSQSNIYPERQSDQTYGPTTLQNSKPPQIQANNVAERSPLRGNGPTALTNLNHIKTNNQAERRPHQTFETAIGHNHIQQNHIQGNSLPERRPHQTYGPQLSTIDSRFQSQQNDIQDNTAFKKFKEQVDSLNIKVSSQSRSQKTNDILNFKRGVTAPIGLQNLSNPTQSTESERKPHQTYGPLESKNNDKNNALPQFMSQTGPHRILLQTKFLPKTDAEIEQSIENVDSINVERFPPNLNSTFSHLNSNYNLKSKSIEYSTTTEASYRIQENMLNNEGVDTKYSSDGGYIY